MNLISGILLLFIGFNAIVIPNAQQNMLAAALFLSAFVRLLKYRTPVKILRFFLLPWAVTFLYCCIGLLNNATFESIFQASIIYIVSPIFWILTVDLAWRVFGIEKIITAIAFFAAISCITVPIYIYIFQNYSAESLSFFGKNEANVNISSEWSGVTMHVLGSIIFFSAAFFAQPEVVQNRFFRITLLAMLSVAVFIGGRTAVFFSMAIGITAHVILNYRFSVRSTIRLIISILGLVGLLIYFVQGLLGVDLLLLIKGHFIEKTTLDEERPAQIAALFQGALDNLFLGSGHGIGVSYSRSDEFPWRYEAVYFALLFKIGIFGLISVLYPYCRAMYVFARRILQNKSRRYDLFFGIGFFSALLASFTNPYIEAFSFQWMYILPLYYFLENRLEH